LGLIRLEFEGGKEKIDSTMSILPPTPRRDKPKLLDQRATRFTANITVSEPSKHIAIGSADSFYFMVSVATRGDLSYQRYQREVTQ